MMIHNKTKQIMTMMMMIKENNVNATNLDGWIIIIKNKNNDTFDLARMKNIENLIDWWSENKFLMSFFFLFKMTEMNRKTDW